MDHHSDRPSAFLVRNIGLLPPGRALDIAVGGGRNAVYLARKGFHVEGVDISAEKVAEASQKACALGLPLKGIVADLEGAYRIEPETYEVIMCFHYLQRSLLSQIKNGLKSGGVVVYETFTTDQPRFGKPTNPDYLLRPGELRQAFRELECLRYWEGVVGHRKAIARIIARKGKMPIHQIMTPEFTAEKAEPEMANSAAAGQLHKFLRALCASAVKTECLSF